MMWDEQRNLQVRWRYEVLGGHVHVRVFTRTLPTETWAKCGDLVFDEREWPTIRAMHTLAGVDFVGDDRESI
ncbi:MAG: hypothetical protein AAFR76_01370 [Planctomycetota bacterium]